MLEKLEPIDYFLYDNTTSSDQGRDWGIKAATGMLSGHKELRNKFLDYCRMTFGTSPSELSGFSSALGGFFLQDPGSYRYVLCVTIETKDHKDRNSLAIVGLLFTGKDSLDLFLEHCDPLLTARGIFTKKTPPEKLEPVRKSYQEIPGSNALFNEWQKMGPNAIRLERFDKKQSTGFTIDLLINCIRDKKNDKRLPAILGISSRLKKEELSGSNYDIVFCHDGDQKQGLTLPITIRKELKITRYGTGGESTESKSREKSKRKKPSLLKFFLWLLIIFFIFLFIYRIATFNIHDKSKDAGKEALSTQTSPIDSSDEQSSQEETAPGSELYRGGDFLRHVQYLLDRLEAMNPAELEETFAYRVVQEVEVLDRFEMKRTELREILENTLPGLRESLLNLNLLYYFEEKTRKELSEEKRAEIIRNKIEELNREQNAYNQLENAYRKLEEAFGIEFRSGNGTFSRWFELLREFYQKK